MKSQSVRRPQEAFSANFFAISRLSLRTFGLSLSSWVLRTQLSRPPTCSTERRPWVDTRSFTLCSSASEISVTFCRFGRNVRLVLLLAWETLLPTCRPLPVSSQTRDMTSPFDVFERTKASGKRRPIPLHGQLVNLRRRLDFVGNRTEAGAFADY